jgi:hypothetical protein
VKGGGLMSGISRKDAPWRGYAASNAQIGLLRKLGVDAPSGIDKGTASQWITHALAVKRIEGLK